MLQMVGLTQFSLFWEVVCSLMQNIKECYTVKRVLFAGVNVRDIEITANSRFLIFAVDRIIK